MPATASPPLRKNSKTHVSHLMQCPQSSKSASSPHSSFNASSAPRAIPINPLKLAEQPRSLSMSNISPSNSSAGSYNSYKSENLLENKYGSYQENSLLGRGATACVRLVVVKNDGANNGRAGGGDRSDEDDDEEDEGIATSPPSVFSSGDTLFDEESSGKTIVRSPPSTSRFEKYSKSFKDTMVAVKVCFKNNRDVCTWVCSSDSISFSSLPRNSENGSRMKAKKSTSRS